MLTCRANGADLDLISRDTESFKLQDIDLFGIEKVFAIVFGNDSLRIGDKVLDNLPAHLITASPNRRADPDDQIGGAGAVEVPHRLNGFADDLLLCPPPTCMHSSDRPMHRIDNQQRYAIGRQNRQYHTGEIRYQRIGLE